MFYKFLGMAVWNGGKLYLRRRYGSTYVPKPVLVGAAVAGIAGVALALAAARREGSDGG
jgi:hypothetical protein